MSLKANTFIKEIYTFSPIFFKNLEASLYSLIVSGKKYGPVFDRWSGILRDSDYWDANAIDNYQSNLLAFFLRSAYDNCLFYKQSGLKIDNGFDNECAKSILKEMPIINKMDVLENYKNIINNKKNDGSKFIKFTSSGTTGTSLSIYMNNDCYQREYAFRWKFLSIAGAQRKDRFAYFLGNTLFPVSKKKPPYHIVDYYERGIFFSIFHLSKSTISDYIKAFNDFSADYVKGYPSGLYSFAALAKEKGLTINNVKAVFSASEVLHSYQRTIIEHVFQAPVFQWYGQVETTVNLHECDKHRLHVKEEYGLLELINENGEPCKPGEIGSAIGTGWGNTVFPLIRYDTGDNMILSKEQICPCGRSGRIIEKIIGRDEDVIITPDGRHIGRLDFVFKPIETVKEAQIVQEDIDRIRIRVVPFANYSVKERDKIKSILQQYLGNSINYTIEEVDVLERTSAGKIKYVVSKVSHIAR